MKKFILLMMLLIPVSMVAKKKVKYKKVYDFYVTSPQDAKLKYYEDSRVSFTFDWKEYKNYCISVRIKNLTDSRIYVEWENARIDNSQVTFDTDTYRNYQDPKPDEVIHGGSYTERNLMERKYIHSSIGIFPIDFMKYGGDSSSCNLIIPIRFGDEVVDYKITVILYVVHFLHT